MADTEFAGPTCFQRGDTLYINQRGERVALQRSTSIRYQVTEASEKKLFDEPAGAGLDRRPLAELETTKLAFIAQIQELGHDKPGCCRGRGRRGTGHASARAHILASFTTEWRAYPMTTWGATAERPDVTVRAEALGYTKEMSGHEGDRRMERTNPGADRRRLLTARRAGTCSRDGPSHVGWRAATATAPRWAPGCSTMWRPGPANGDSSTTSNSQYRNPAFTGDITFVRGRVTDKRVERRRRHLATVEVELTNQDDAVMAKGTADVELPASDT